MDRGTRPVENVVAPPWKDRCAFVTGHTGFVGGWLSLWLARLGTQVHGLALDPSTHPSLFETAKIASVLRADLRGDVRNASDVRKAMEDARPEIVFHLAAQPLVLESYRSPIDTLATNVLGTAHVLEAARHVKTVKAVIIVTSDKCYRNQPRPLQEDDPLGGYDLYSSSKACAELATESYRSSFFSTPGAAAIASVRAGNVIGGGDWAENRLVPDCVRAVGSGQPVELRRPNAVRPWQHVLEAVSGYVALAERLLGDQPALYSRAWNFGPSLESSATVGEVARSTMHELGGNVIEHPSPSAPHEEDQLLLNSERAGKELGWHPKWTLKKAVIETTDWYKTWMQGQDMAKITREQIARYVGP